MANFNITKNTENLLKALSLLQQAENIGSDAILSLYGDKAGEEYLDSLTEAKKTIEEYLVENIKQENFKDINNI